MKTKENSIFIGFFILCTIISIGIIYILLVRPQKVVVESIDHTKDEIEFLYKESELNPSAEKLIELSKEGKHLVVVLLTPKRRLLANYQYDSVLENLKKCNNQLPCPLFKLDKKTFEAKAKRRKDLPYKKGQIRI